MTSTCAFKVVACGCLQEQLVAGVQGRYPPGYNSESGKPKRYGNKAARWKALDEKLTLRQLLLVEDFIIPGVPVLFVLSRGTDYERAFVEQVEE